jgi:hypothetical protein
MTSAVLNFVRTRFGGHRYLRTRTALSYIGIMVAFCLLAALVLAL